VRLSNSPDVSVIQHVLITLVLRLIMNDGFSVNSANRLFRVLPGFMGKLLFPPSEVQQNVTTKLAHAHEQSEFTYDAYLVAAGQLQKVSQSLRLVRLRLV